MIDSVFLAKLAATELYKEPVDGLSDTLKSQVPNGLTEEVLVRAADTIIRTHGSGAFPKLPACLRAIEEAQHRAPTLMQPAKPGASGVTRENYAELAATRSRRNPGGKPFVISRTDNDAEWMAWERYFAEIGFKASASMMREKMASSWTVPAMWPDEFDATAPSRFR